MLLCRRFLNRLLGLPVARQNLLFSYFACTLTAEIRAAKAEGRYFEGVSDLSGSNITEILKPKVRACSQLHALLLLTYFVVCCACIHTQELTGIIITHDSSCVQCVA